PGAPRSWASEAATLAGRAPGGRYSAAEVPRARSGHAARDQPDLRGPRPPRHPPREPGHPADAAPPRARAADAEREDRDRRGVAGRPRGLARRAGGAAAAAARLAPAGLLPLQHQAGALGPGDQRALLVEH